MIEVKNIDRKIVARYLGMKPEDMNDVMNGLIDEAEELLKKDSEISYVCGIYDIIIKEDGIGFDEVSIVLPGSDIAKLLKGCEKGVLMCVTLSGFIDTRIRTLQIKNMPLALVYDACASVAIDQVCDDVQAYIRERLPEYVQTMRFSPGYGDLPLTIQREFLDCIDAGKRCGVSLTEGGMLTPTKTVTAVFGLKTLDEFLKHDMKTGNFSSFIPEKGGCGDESVCSKCKAAGKCSMANKNVKESINSKNSENTDNTNNAENTDNM
ncbi:MAG: hypothetical protein ACI39R_01075 [Lachnospiraceae bacterium]